MPSLDHLRLFVRVADRRSVSQAARDLAMPQPTASRRLGQLEDYFGQPLFHRSTRSITLTHAGERCLAYARDALEKELTLRDALSGSKQGWDGKLTISAPTAFGTWVVLPAVCAFKQEHPHLAVDLRLSDRYADMISEGIDVSLRIGQLEDSQLVASRVLSLREVIVCHPDLAADIDRNDPKQVQGLPWIRFSGLRDTQSVELRRDGKALHLKVRPAFWIDNIVALRETMLQSVGVSLIHRYAVADDIKAGRLVHLLPGWQLPRWPVSIVTPYGRRNPRVAAFSAYIKRYLRKTID
jgi:DNA-binding transcriptional LysR family regulator